jgi:acyl-coenzyme A synthetase/AMP-(fatty) acid ligase
VVPGAPAGNQTRGSAPDAPGELSRQDIEAGVVPRLHALIRTRPSAIAAADERRRVTFAELARQAATVRAAVRATPGRGPVGLLHGHDSGAAGALLGIIASGRPLVVLDPQSPAPRLRRLLSRARSGICVTDAEHAEQASAAAARVVVADRLVPATETIDQLWSAPPDPASPAVLAFTSGTTGRPKIVANSHRMLVRDAWANSVATGCYGDGDVVAHTLPMAFHAGLMAAVAGVLVGATLRFNDVRSSGLGTLAPWLHECGATVAHLSPQSVRALVAAHPDPTLLAGLRAVTVAGEALYGPDAEALRALLGPDCTVHNRYGSSETGLICDYPVRRSDPLPHGPIPVGPAVGGWRVSLVGDDGAALDADTVGIVTVTGEDLGSGYWDDPAATTEAFTEHPDGTHSYRSNDLGRLDEAGRLCLVGRRDFSIKIGDYLVEPGEVDAALFELPEIHEAVTIGVPSPDGASHQLVAYVVSTGPTAGVASVHAGLRALLPPHMVPETVVFLDALPRTERGKIDRAGLARCDPIA